MHDQIWDLYEEGLSAAKIALVVSKAAPSVAEYIRNDGGIRPTSEAAPLDSSPLLSMRRSLEVSQLARRFGRSLPVWAGRHRR